MISLMTTLPANVASGSSVYVQSPPANALGVTAKSKMPWFAAQRTSTTPLGGGKNAKVYGPAPDPVTERADRLLINRSFELTPETGSVNVTRICVSERTVTCAGGSTMATVGATLSGVL